MGRRRQVLPTLTALVAVHTGILALPADSGADAGQVGGGAVGHRVSVSWDGDAPATSGPLPSVTLPASGGEASDQAAGVAVAHERADAPFGGALLETARLTVAARGATEASPSPTSSALVADVEALGGVLAAARMASSCTSGEDGVMASATLDAATLVASPTQTLALPAAPAPNTRYAASDPESGESFTVVLNEQHVDAGGVSVIAVHVVLDGPRGSGDIVVAESRCAVTASTGPSSSSTSSSSTSSSSTSTVPATSSTVPASVPPPGDDEADGAGDGSPDSPEALTPVHRPRAETPADPAFAAASAGATAQPDVSAVSGGAYGFSSVVSLFGGPAATKGPEPSVELPPGGATPALTATRPSAAAEYGPATLFRSGPLSVRTEGKTGAGGSVTSSASVQGAEPGQRPGPFLYDAVRSTCTATEAGVNAATTIQGGVVETKYDPNTQQPVTTVPVPASPAPNTEHTGTLDHVGDSFRIVFNEQTRNADGSLTVNAAHLYLLGPTAKGDLVIGQSRCGVTAAAASTAPAATPTGDGAAGGVDGSAAARSPQAASPAAAGATGRARTSGTGAGRPLANTGGDTPLLPAAALLAAAVVARRLARPRRQGERA